MSGAAGRDWEEHGQLFCGFYLLFPSQPGCPPRFKNFPQTRQCKTPFPGRISVLSSFVSLFIFYVLSYLLSKTMGCFSGHLMTSASNQKLFCEVCSVFRYSFDEFVGEKVVAPSYSSAILAPPSKHGQLLRGSLVAKESQERDQSVMEKAWTNEGLFYCDMMFKVGS